MFYCWFTFSFAFVTGCFVIFLERSGLHIKKRKFRYGYAHITGRTCLAFALYIWAQSLARLDWICNAESVTNPIPIELLLSCLSALGSTITPEELAIYLIMSNHIMRHLGLVSILACNFLLYADFIQITKQAFHRNFELLYFWTRCLFMVIAFAIYILLPAIVLANQLHTADSPSIHRGATIE